MASFITAALRGVRGALADTDSTATANTATNAHADTSANIHADVGGIPDIRDVAARHDPASFHNQAAARPVGAGAKPSVTDHGNGTENGKAPASASIFYGGSAWTLGAGWPQPMSAAPASLPTPVGASIGLPPEPASTGSSGAFTCGIEGGAKAGGAANHRGINAKRGADVASGGDADEALSNKDLATPTLPQFFPRVRRGECGPIKTMDLIETLVDRPPNTKGLDPLFGQFDIIPRHANGLRNSEARISQFILARLIASTGRFVVFEELTIPISETAKETAEAGRPLNLQYTQALDGRRHQRGTFRADIVAFDLDTGVAHLLECKRSVNSLGAGEKRKRLMARMEAAAMCLPDVLRRQGLQVQQVRPRIIDLTGTGGRDQMIIRVGDIDNCLGVTGIDAALKQERARVERAIQKRIREFIADIVMKSADTLGLRVARIKENGDERNDVCGNGPPIGLPAPHAADPIDLTGGQPLSSQEPVMLHAAPLAPGWTAAALPGWGPSAGNVMPEFWASRPGESLRGDR
jgi:hypothetical protein